MNRTAILRMYHNHRAERDWKAASRAAKAYHSNACWKWLRVLLQAEVAYKAAWQSEETFPRIGFPYSPSY
jgi:hypothetical protein